MCPVCAHEYREPSDRRFHAQPIACPVCGPELRLLDRHGRVLGGDPLNRAAQALSLGRIVAVKSIGGFQLACDASNDCAVRTLRARKHRPTKPLALMCGALEAVRKFCRVSRAAGKLLVSPAAPIVLLPRAGIPGSVRVPSSVAPGSPRLGVMLAYTPLHHLLLERLGSNAVLVMTSCNRRDEPSSPTRAGGPRSFFEALTRAMRERGAGRAAFAAGPSRAASARAPKQECLTRLRKKGSQDRGRKRTRPRVNPPRPEIARSDARSIQPLWPVSSAATSMMVMAAMAVTGGSQGCWVMGLRTMCGRARRGRRSSMSPRQVRCQ